MWSAIHGEGLTLRVARDSLGELDEENGQDNATVNVQRRRGREIKRRQKDSENPDFFMSREWIITNKKGGIGIFFLIFFLNSLLMQCWQVKYITF